MKKLLMMTKKIHFYDRFFVSNQNFTTEHVKLIKFQVFFNIAQIPGFSKSFYCLNCQFPGFSKFQAILATLYMVPKAYNIRFSISKSTYLKFVETFKVLINGKKYSTIVIKLYKIRINR